MDKITFPSYPHILLLPTSKGGVNNNIHKGGVIEVSKERLYSYKNDVINRLEDELFYKDQKIMFLESRVKSLEGAIENDYKRQLNLADLDYKRLYQKHKKLLKRFAELDTCAEPN